VESRRCSSFLIVEKGGTVGMGTLSSWPEAGQGGAKEHPVPTLQFLLRVRDHTVAVDGIFGPKTGEAVRAFQRQMRLAVDGIVGPMTWQALVSGMLSY
jgi:peptidoglycan hydrolase-like protein with peptidoglycan-binding domain